MGVSAVIGALGVNESRKARKDAKAEAEKQRADMQLAKDEAEEERRIATESKATGSMSTTSRISSEKAMRRRRAGRGRAATVMDETNYLG